MLLFLKFLKLFIFLFSLFGNFDNSYKLFVKHIGNFGSEIGGNIRKFPIVTGAEFRP